MLPSSWAKEVRPVPQRDEVEIDSGEDVARVEWM